MNIDSIDKKIWDAISERLGVMGIKFQNISYEFRLVLAQQLNTIYHNDPRSASKTLQALIQKLNGKTDVEAFYRLLESPSKELKENGASRAISLILFNKSVDDFFSISSPDIPASQSHGEDTETGSDSSLDIKRPFSGLSTSAWAEMFREKFKVLWNGLAIEFLRRDTQLVTEIQKQPTQNAKILVWLTTELSKTFNVEYERSSQIIRDITGDRATQTTINRYISAAYRLANLEVPATYIAKKSASLDETIKAMAKDERTKDAWAIFSEQYTNHPTGAFSERKIFNILMQKMSTVLASGVANIEGNWKKILLHDLSTLTTDRYISVLNRIACPIPAEPSHQSPSAKGAPCVPS